jgi:hypothetical protein
MGAGIMHQGVPRNQDNVLESDKLFGTLLQLIGLGLDMGSGPHFLVANSRLAVSTWK